MTEFFKPVCRLLHGSPLKGYNLKLFSVNSISNFCHYGSIVISLGVIVVGRALRYAALAHKKKL